MLENYGKRVLSFVMALIMVFSMVPTQAFATESGEDHELCEVCGLHEHDCTCPELCPDCGQEVCVCEDEPEVCAECLQEVCVCETAAPEEEAAVPEESSEPALEIVDVTVTAPAEDQLEPEEPQTCPDCGEAECVCEDAPFQRVIPEDWTDEMVEIQEFIQSEIYEYWLEYYEFQMPDQDKFAPIVEAMIDETVEVPEELAAEWETVHAQIEDIVLNEMDDGTRENALGSVKQVEDLMNGYLEAELITEDELQDIYVFNPVLLDFAQLTYTYGVAENLLATTDITNSVSVSGLTVSYDHYRPTSSLGTDGTTDCKGTQSSITASASAAKSSFLTGGKVTAATVTITLTNTVYDEAVLSFTYTDNNSKGTVTTTGTAISNTGSDRSFTLSKGQNVKVVLNTGTSGTTKYTLTLANIALKGTVNFASGENGTYTVSGGTLSGEVAAPTSDISACGTAYTLKATPAEGGYRLIGWYNGTTLLSTDNPYTYYNKGNMTVTPVFAIPTYVTTFKAPVGTGSYTVNGAEWTAEFSETDASFTLVASHAKEQKFLGWYDGNGNLLSDQLTFDYVVPADGSVHPKFEDLPRYDINVEYDTAGGTVAGAGADAGLHGCDTLLTATPNEGCNFLGWTDTSGKILSTAASYRVTTTADMTLRAVFAKDGGAPVWMTGKAISGSYKDFNSDGLNGFLGSMAATEVKFNTISATHLYTEWDKAIASGNKHIVLMNNATLPARETAYELPKDYTLLIPFDDANTTYTTTAASVKGGAYTQPTAYRTLTMADGAELVVKGGLSISGKHQYCTSNSGNGSAPNGPQGFIRMNSGSKITLESGGALYAYGYITGSGSVEAKSGSSVYELFQIGDFRGGTQSTAMKNRVFPLTLYYVQNVEVPMTIHAGATEYAFTTIYMASAAIASSVAFMGKGCMFNFSDGYVVKRYDGSRDRTIIDSYATLGLDGAELPVGTSSISSSDYVLGINGAFTVNVHSGSVQIGQDIALLPGSEFNLLDTTANVTLKDGVSVYIYDADEWGPYCYQDGVNTKFIPLIYAPGRTYTRTEADLTDAEVYINGILDASKGHIYTTAGGAQITGDTNAMVKINSTTVAGTTYQMEMNINPEAYTGNDNYIVDGTKVAEADAYRKIPVTPAKLMNGDGTYTETEGKATAENDTFNYRNNFWHTPECGGSFDEGVATTNPTCQTDGVKTYTCLCGKVAKEAIPKDAKYHVPNVDDPTCTVAKVCTVEGCGETLEEMKSHNKDMTEKVNANCATGTNGCEAYYFCDSCSLYYAAEGDVKIGNADDLTIWQAEGGDGFISGAHTPGDWLEDNEIASTCTEYGTHDEYQICAVCKLELDGTRKTVDNTSLADHIYLAVSGKADSCKEGVTGYKDSFRCQACEQYFAEKNPDSKIGDGSQAAWDAWTTTGDGVIDTAEHVSNGETVGCTTAETCKNCNTVLTPAKGHTTATKQEDHIVDGVKDESKYDLVTYCSECDTELNRITVDVSAPANHVIENYERVEPTCTVPGTTAGAKCVAENCAVCTSSGVVYQTGMEEIPALGHTFEGISSNSVTYTFDKENSKCTASGKCTRENCGADHSETVDASVTETKLSCTTDHTKTYTADFTGIPGLKNYTETDIIEKTTGHDWSTEVSYTELEDADNCTATQACGNKCGEIRTSEAAVIKTEVHATCTKDGYITYFADFQEIWAADQTKKVAGDPATGHTWTVNENSVSWAEKTCTLSCACGATVEAAFEVSEKVIKVDDCENVGEILYTGTFKAEGVFAGDTMPAALTKTEYPDAVQHAWGEPTYVWSDDYTKCTATRTCSNGEHPQTETVDATAGENTANCTAGGKITYTSAAFVNTAFAVQKKDVTTAPLGHNVEAVEKVSPTCQNTGTDAHFKCERCQKLFLTEADATENKVADGDDLIMATVSCSFGEYVYNNDASCTKAGTKTAVCAFGCGKTNTMDDEANPQLAHAFTNYIYNNDATCQKPGTETAECDTCDTGTKDTRNSEKHPLMEHAYTKEEVVKKATCTTAGAKMLTCVNGCNSSENIEIPAQGHVYVEQQGKAATCYEAGWNAYYQCTAEENAERTFCGLYFANDGDNATINPATWKTGDGKINKVAHDYKSVVTEPTCLTEGYTTYTCQNDECTDDAEDHTIVGDRKDALGHNYDNGAVTTQPTCTEEGIKTFTCTNDCCTEQTKGHTTTESVPVLGHELVEIAGKAATCDAAGYNACYQCAPVSKTGERIYCGYYFADAKDTAATATPIATAKAELTTWQETLGENGGAIARLQHEDTDNDHLCDQPGCDDKLTDCVDANSDHNCDFEGCKQLLTQCVDNDMDHFCDFEGCPKKLSECADADDDQDHNCDHCGEPYGDHVFTNGKCNCDYVQDLKVNITIKAEGQIDQKLDEETIKYLNKGNDFTKTLDLSKFGKCYEIKNLSATVGNADIEHSATGTTLTIKSELLTGDVDIIVNAEQNHKVGPVNTSEIPATCNDPGEKKTEITCLNCNTVYHVTTEEIPAKGHDYESKYTAPTFDKDGFTTYTCKNGCGGSYEKIDEGTKLIAVARIGSTRYQTLEEAIAAAAGTFDTIYLLSKVTVADTQVWDLQDATLIIANDSENYGLVIKGDLTIKSGTIRTQGMLGIGVSASGKLTIEDGEFRVTGQSDYLIGSWGTTVINGGNFVGQYNCVNGFAGSLTISGGTFKTAETDWSGSYESSDVFAEDEGIEVAITGGTFSKSVEDYLADGYCQLKSGKTYEVAAHEPRESFRDQEVAATCDTDGSFDLVTECDRCEAELSRVPNVIPATGHTVEVIAGKAATCLEDGYHEAYYCSVCEKYFATRDAENDKLLSGEIQDLVAWQTTEKAGKIGALGHELVHNEEVPAACETSGVNEYWQCSRCAAAFEDDQENTPIADLDTWKAEGGNGYIDATGHNYTSEVTQAPSCTEAGVRTYICQNDGCNKKTYTEPVDALGHKYKVEYTWNDDLTACTASAVCENSGCYSQATKTVLATRTVVTNATCENDGSGYMTATFTENEMNTYGFAPQTRELVIPATGHSFTKYVSDNNTTCTEDGTKTAVCDNGCGKSDTVANTGAAPGHSMEEIAAVEPTCTNNGIIHHYRCGRCLGRFLDEDGTQPVETGKHIAPALQHEYTTKVTEATCEEQGYTTYTCIRGDHTYQDNVVSALKHDWNEGEILEGDEPTCTDAGTKTFTCVRGCTKTEVVKATGHKGQTVSGQAANCTETGWNAYYQCQNSCGLFYKDYECTKLIGDAAALEAWKQGEGKTGPYGHTYGNVSGKTPDCENAGYLASFVCSKSYCALYFTEDEAGEKVLIGDGSQAAYDAWKAEGGAGYLKANGHKPGEEYTDPKSIKAPTCTEDGSHDVVTDCTVCEKETSRVKVVDSKTNHANQIEIPAKDATCNATGWTAGVECKDCGETLVAQTTIAKLSHTEVVDEEVPATCTKTGLTAGKHCSVCGTVTVVQAEIPMVPHKLSVEAESTKLPTCTVDGEQTLGCVDCDYETHEILKATGHQSITAKEEQSPSCTTIGYEAYWQCGDCNVMFSDVEGKTIIADKVVIPAKGHNYAWEGGIVITDPTCTERGYTTRTCFVCGNVTEDTYTDVVPHTTVVDEAVPATCTATGLTEGTHCSACGKTLTAQQVTNVVPHTEVTDKAVPATCTATGLTEGKHCAVCDWKVEQEKVPAKGHKGFIVKGQPAKCEADGWKDYYQCGNGCQQFFEDLECTKRIENVKAWQIDENGGKISKLGHTWDTGRVTTLPDCVTDGVKTFTCGTCNGTREEAEPMLGHETETHAGQHPTYYSAGWNEYETCTRCDYSTFETIEPLGEPNVGTYEEFMTSLEMLEEYANAYAKANPGKDPMLLLIKYVRTGVDRYNSGSWNIMAGYEDEGFAEYVMKQEEEINKAVPTVDDMINVTGIKNIKNFKLPNGDGVDFGHMFGTMDITYHNKNSINHADVSGWAGDLVDLLSTADRHDVTGTVDEMIEEIGKTYLNHSIEGESDQFSQTDMYGDLDGYYFMNELIGTDYEPGMLYNMMDEYFVSSLTTEQRADYFLKNRLGGVTSRNDIRDAVFSEYTGNSVIATLEGTREFKQADVSDMRKACCYAFADYLCKLAGDFVEMNEDRYLSVFSTETATLAPGITQQISKATTTDGKQVVYYTATADVNSSYVHVFANYKDNNPAGGWGMQRVLDQANAAQAKYGDPASEYYIPNYNVIASVNGSGYNMTTGEPSGVLMMNGVEYHAPGGGFFGVLKDGSPCMGSDEDYYALKEQGLLSEAIDMFGAVLVKDGKINVSANDFGRASRTAIGYTKTGKIVVMVMDGRQEPVSCGGSMAEIAQVMLDAGCVYAVNMDGGGSTTYVARQPGEEELRCVSSPSDGFQRSVSTSWLIVSTAPSSTAFDHAVLDSDYRYMTIGSSVQVTAAGVSATGNPVELPEGAIWAVSDANVASISEDGVVTAKANGKVDVRLMLGDQIIGTRTLNVVVPDAVYFTKQNMNAVYGEPVTLPVAALYENKDVAITEADVTFILSNAAAGTTEGFTFTGIEASNIKTVKINALAVNNPDAASGSININMFKPGEASFDFDNADGGDRLLAWHRVVSNSNTTDDVTYTAIEKDKDMVTEYTFGMDMTQIPMPEKLTDLVYMLPGADVEGNNSAWSFLLQLAERVSVLTEVRATLKLDPNFDVDYSKMSVNCEYFALEETIFNAETNELILSLRWKDQTKAIDPDTANPMVILAGIKLTPKADAAWSAKDLLNVVNSGNISYDIYLRANALYSFACKPENQETYDIYPFMNKDVIIGGAPESGGHFKDVYKEFADEYTLNKGKLQGWVYEEGGYAYYVDGEKYFGIQKVGDFYYDFGANGINIGQTKYTGMFQINGVNHYAQAGVLTGGWFIDGDKNYYFDQNGKAVDGEIILDEVRMVFDNGLHIGGHSGFLKKSDGKTYYYQNGSMYYGWLQLGDKWYHFNAETGVMTVGDGTANTKLFPDDEAKAKGAYYVFNAEGHALYGFPNNFGYYYWASQPIRNKWVINGNDLDGVYHTNENGHFVTTSDASQLFQLTLGDKTYTAVKIAFDGVVYTFDNSSGKLLQGSLVLKDGKWYYYWAGEPVNDGWFEFNGDTYYAYEDGHLATGTHTIDGKSYMFTTQGALIVKGATLDITMSDDLTKMTIKANNIENAKRVKMAVWSEASNQQDMKWFDATKGTDGVWTAVIDPMCQYKSTGTYHVHAYAIDESGAAVSLLVNTTYEVAKIGHTAGQPVKQNVVATTCVKDGSYDLVTTCVNCDVVIKTEHVVEKSNGTHVYDNNVDGICNVCGVDRAEVEHKYRQVVHMFRMYNPNTGEHFYTGSEVERDNLIGHGWKYEGVGFTFPANTGAPVHRLFQPSTGEHLYTMNEAEKDKLMAEGWNYEGIAFNSAYDTEAVQHRLHNPNATVGAYHFTYSVEEKQNLIDAGWEYEGIGWYSCFK